MPIKRLNVATDLFDTLGRFDIRLYGAAVDGVTDDTDAVMDAFNAAIAANGGIIYFPRGTTRINSAGTFLNAGANELGMFIVQGEGSASAIKLTNYAGGFLGWGNCSMVAVRDLLFYGRDNGGGGSDSTAEGTGPMIESSTTWLSVFERCFFVGLGTSSTTQGLINLHTTRAVFRDCHFGGCTAPDFSVVASEQAIVSMENCMFIDYHAYNGTLYSKSSTLGQPENWIRSANQGAIGVPGRPRIVDIRSTVFDEACTDSCIQVDGTADDTVSLEDVGFNGLVNSAGPSVVCNTLHELRVRNMWSGYQQNANYAGLSLTDVANVDIDGLIYDDDATDLTLLGTTKRLRLRNAQDVTIVNTAGAFIDADQAMPTTASAAALAPKGKITHVTGTDTITSITTTNCRAGDDLTLIFDSTAAINDGNNLVLAGNFTGGANRVLKLEFDGTNFYELSRSSN